MKRILVMCLVVCFAVMGISGVASAATKAGDTTVFGTLSYDATTFEPESGSSLDISIFAASFGVGRFFTDSFQTEIGLIGQTMTLSNGGSETIQQLGLAVRPNFHFNTAANTEPYIGLTLGYLWADLFDESTGAFLYGGQAGIKQFMNDNSYLQFEAGYTVSTLDFDGMDLDTGDLRLSVGFGCKF